jgi:hypothetical protein
MPRQGEPQQLAAVAREVLEHRLVAPRLRPAVDRALRQARRCGIVDGRSSADRVITWVERSSLERIGDIDGMVFHPLRSRQLEKTLERGIAE